MSSTSASRISPCVCGDDPITRNLKRVYEQVAAEPIPPDLMKLLDQLGDRNGEDK
jgi:hypothetical protein